MLACQALLGFAVCMRAAGVGECSLSDARDCPYRNMESEMPQAAKSAAPSLKSLDTEALTQEFAEHGYLVFRNVVSAPQLANLHRQLSEAFKRERESGALFSGG